MRDAELLSTLTRRSFIMAGGEAALFLIIIGQLYNLQIMQSRKYSRLSDKNSIRIKLVLPPRGKIVDRHGTEIAGYKNVYDIQMIPEEITAQGEKVDDIIDRLGKHIKLDADIKDKIKQQIKKKRAFFPVVVKTQLKWEEMAKIQVENLSLPGVYIEEVPMRNYPLGEPAAHVIGYVSPADEADVKNEANPMLAHPDFRIGKAGVEKIKDKELRGDAGEEVQIVNALGRVISTDESRRKPPSAGKTVALTINAELQKFATERLVTQQSGAAVVMDIWNGDIIVMASSPTYDPNIFQDEERTAEEFKALLANPYKPFMNKNLEGTYPPGSTFKMMTAMAALETGVIKPDTKFRCPGHYDFGGRRFNCWREKGHGLVDLENSLAWSCDVYYYNIAAAVDIDAIHSMATRFGLGQISGIELANEKSGQIPSRKWKERYRAEQWYQGDTISAAIGQGYNQTTILQLAQMSARIANGGLAVAPRVLKSANEDIPNFAQIPVNLGHLELMKRGMFKVVNMEGGTGRTAMFNYHGATMAGKTGTSQVRSMTEAERKIPQSLVPWEHRHHALFTGFAPFDNPRFAIAVIVEHGASGSGAAGPIAKEIMRKCVEAER